VAIAFLEQVFTALHRVREQNQHSSESTFFSRGAAPEEPIVDFGLLTLGFRSAVDNRARLPFRSSPGLFFIASMSALGGADNLTALPLRSRVGVAFIESIVLLYM
jgi:hypothetical protein